MKREIKFRAWVIRSESAIDINKMRYEDNQTIFGWKADGVTMEIMQFTGLKDNNGKEIYEGDIITGTEGKYSFIVKMRRDSWKAVSFDERDVFSIPDHWEVIGNQFENPELFTEIIVKDMKGTVKRYWTTDEVDERVKQKCREERLKVVAEIFKDFRNTRYQDDLKLITIIESKK